MQGRNKALWLIGARHSILARCKISPPRSIDGFQASETKNSRKTGLCTELEFHFQNSCETLGSQESELPEKWTLRCFFSIRKMRSKKRRPRFPKFASTGTQTNVFHQLRCSFCLEFDAILDVSAGFHLTPNARAPKSKPLPYP